MNKIILSAEGQGQIDGSTQREEVYVQLYGKSDPLKNEIRRSLERFTAWPDSQVRVSDGGPERGVENRLAQTRGGAEERMLKLHSWVDEADAGVEMVGFPSYYCAEGVFSVQGSREIRKKEIVLMESLFAAVRDGARLFKYVKGGPGEMDPREVCAFVSRRLRGFQVGGVEYGLRKLRDRWAMVFEVFEYGEEVSRDEWRGGPT